MAEDDGDGLSFASAGVGHEAHGQRVDAVARILGGHPLSEEDVPQVSPTMVAADLGPPAIGIGDPSNRPGDLIIEAGPSAPGVELVHGPVEGRVAAAAVV